MGATNNTTYYNLSQFVGTDKPAWLQDYNGDMNKIDAGIHQAKAAADAAQGDATQALTDSGNNTTAIGNLQTDVGNLRTATGNNAGAINSINSLIGNGTPTTTDQTIIGGINELNAGKANKRKLLYTATGNGVKTYKSLFKEIYDNVSEWSDTSKYMIVWKSGNYQTVYYPAWSGMPSDSPAYFTAITVFPGQVTMNGIRIGSTDASCGFHTYEIASDGTITNTNKNTDVVTSDVSFALYEMM